MKMYVIKYTASMGAGKAKLSESGSYRMPGASADSVKEIFATLLKCSNGVILDKTIWPISAGAVIKLESIEPERNATKK